MSLTTTYRRRDEAEKVVFDDLRVVRTRGDGVSESVKWDDLAEVGILTADESVSRDGFVIVLLSRDGHSGCAVPRDVPGADRLLARLHLLPGFDASKVAAAGASAGVARFTCWKRPI